MKEATSRLSLQGWLFAHTPVGWSGKTSPEYCRAGKEAILPPSYRCSSGGKFPSPSGSGRRPDSSQEPPDATAWVGECLTLNIPEFNNFRGRSRSEGVVSSLSEVLVRGPIAPKYFLTVKCAAGMYRRVEKRGKTLPPVLAAGARNFAVVRAVCGCRDHEAAIRRLIDIFREARQKA